jgi:hypothetical protein
VSDRQQQLEKIRSQDGFIAALDQSGGSTPKALRLYGIEESAYSNDEEMFDLVHAMRTRIVTSPAFDGKRILGAILFEMTLDRDIAGQNSAAYLWKDTDLNILILQIYRVVGDVPPIIGDGIDHRVGVDSTLSSLVGAARVESWIHIGRSDLISGDHNRLLPDPYVFSFHRRRANEKNNAR